MPILTVTTAATDVTLLTLAETREAVGVTDGSQDAALETLRKRVSAAITKACRVAEAGATPPTLRLEVLSETFRLKSSRDHALILSRRPAVSITSITEGATALVAADYELDTSAGLLKRLSGDDYVCWPCGKIVVAYSAGWETVPPDLKGIAAELAQTFWSDSQNFDSNRISFEIPGVYSERRWVDNTDVAPIPEKLMNALRQGGYVNHWVA